MKVENNKKVILFDGVCNLCNSAVNLVIDKDSNDIFRFAALQSDIGMSLCNQHDINPDETDSIILIEGDKVAIKSTAALRIAKSLSGGYPLLYGFIILPKFIRDSVYNFIAKNRYKWYGKRESCRMPTPELQKKFL